VDYCSGVLNGEVGVVVFSVLTSHALEHIEIVELAQDYGDGLETGASGSFHTVMAESDLYVIADLRQQERQRDLGCEDTCRHWLAHV